MFLIVTFKPTPTFLKQAHFIFISNTLISILSNVFMLFVFEEPSVNLLYNCGFLVKDYCYYFFIIYYCYYY